VEYRQNLAINKMNLGNLLWTAKRREEAESLYRDALAIRKQLAEEFPAVASYRQQLAQSQNDLAVRLRALGRREDAETAYHDALQVQKQLAAEFPALPQYRQDLARSHTNLGNLLRDTGRAEEAERTYHDGLRLRQQLAADFPTVSEYRHELAQTLGNMARHLKTKKEYGEARRLLEDAQPHHQAALRASPRHPLYRQFFRTNQATLVSVLAGLGDHAAARETAEQIAGLSWDAVEDAHRAACALASCVPIVEGDMRLSEGRRQELARAYADRSMELLRQAVTHGFKNVDQLKKNTDLKSLQSREDFAKLLQELEQKTEKPGP
jgi:tetratricopeptide (TPR) repeat protein